MCPPCSPRLHHLQGRPPFSEEAPAPTTLRGGNSSCPLCSPGFRSPRQHSPPILGRSPAPTTLQNCTSPCPLLQGGGAEKPSCLFFLQFNIDIFFFRLAGLLFGLAGMLLGPTYKPREIPRSSPASLRSSLASPQTLRIYQYSFYTHT